ncbi:MAG: CBS domain-containing protein [Acidobacteria bacterium]|nr:MAG: CBS domain-containing protein [Acidobacteriota bacterium]REK07371.1 MAG: CBS domain-containing protein [Acidobacteriota bacterium]
MERPRLARDIMVTDLVTVGPHTQVYEGIRLLLRNGITGAPVVDEERRFLGMLSERSCLKVLTVTAQLAAETGAPPITTCARDFMTTKLVSFRPETDALEAIEQLLRRRISGAPVVDENGRLLGVFSERFSMNVLMAFAHDRIPGTEIGPFMNTDFGRVIGPEVPLLEVAEKFLGTHYRRLPVVDGERLVGQISRRDVLRAEHHLTRILQQPGSRLLGTDADARLSEASRLLVEGPMGSGEVHAFMRTDPRTIEEDADLLQIAGIFMNTDYRRLPVLRDGVLVGQISRRDVLQAVLQQISRAPAPEKALLYLSALDETGEQIPR